MDYFWAVLLLLMLLAGWGLTLVSLPGNWLMVAGAGLYAYFIPETSPVRLGWGPVIALLVLALLGELVELVAGALGATSKGGSKRGAVLAAMGAIPGAILGAIVGSLIPIVLHLIAVVLFAGLGALGGAMLGEWWKGRSLNESWEIGQGAFWGRIAGSVAKVTIASIMLAVGIGAVLWSLISHFTAA